MYFHRINRALRAGLKKIDLFPTNQFIRFNKQSQYTTATGGLFSLGLIIIIFILFSNRGVQIINRSIISSTVSSRVDNEPTTIKVNTSPNGGFMFAIGMYGFNLNDPSITYFSISLKQNYYSPILQFINSTQVPLVQYFNKEILQQYKHIGLSQLLCPPLGHDFVVGGKVSSQIFSEFAVTIKKCDSSIIANCAGDAVIATKLAYMGKFILGVPIINTIVNPNDQQYVIQFMEDRNYFTFTTSYGVSAKGEIAQHQINTDVSILPYQDVVTQHINTIPSLLYSKPVPVVNNVYAELLFTKRSSTSTYYRSFSKLDDYFSYVGGLIDCLLAIFFVLKAYSENFFFVQLASSLLVIQDTSFSFESFHIFSFMGVMLKRITNFIGMKVPWTKGELIIRSIDEVKQQLDIVMLIKRVSFLQEAVSCVLSEHQIDVICLKDKRCFQQMAKWREKHKLAQIMTSDYIMKCENGEISSVSLHKQDMSNQSSYQSFSHKDRKELIDKMKNSIDKVVNQAKQNDGVSQRIAQKIDSLMLQKIYQLQSDRIQMELKLFPDEQGLSSSKAQKASENAIYNEFHVDTKQKGNSLIIQNIDL